MKRILVTLILLLVALMPVSAPSIRAAAPAAPLFLGISRPDSANAGDIWTWSGGFSKRTNWGHNYIPILSPGGDWIAYRSDPEFYVKNPPASEDQTPPSSIWIMNVATGQPQLIADQPANASFDEGSESYILRSNPSWSPDGRSLAWTEIVVDASNNVNTDLKDEQLVIYDLDIGQARVAVPKLPEHRFTGKNPYQSEVAWGYPGIAVLTHTTTDTNTEAIYIYALDGALISHSEELANSGYGFSDMIWIEDGDKDYVTNVSGDSMVDPQTGEFVLMDGTPELYSPLHPFGVSLFYGGDTSGEGNPVWQAAVNGAPKITLASSGRYYYQSGIAISPDGKQAAFIIYPGQGTAGGVYLFRAGYKVKLASSAIYNVTGLAWGPTAWRVRHTPDSEG